MADDVARLGIAFESTGAPQVARDTQDVKKNVDDLSKSYSDMAKAQSSAFADAGNKTKAMGGFTREYTEAVKQLGAGQSAALSAVAKTNAEVQRSGSIWSALSGAFSGVSSPLGGVTAKLKEHEAATISASQVTREFGHDLRALNPLLQQMGANVGGLGISFRELSRLGPLGVGLLAVSGITALVAALEQAGDRAEILQKNIEALTGSKKILDDIGESAQRMGTSTESAAESFKALFSGIKGSEFDHAIDSMKQLGDIGFRFAPGGAGQQMALMAGQVTGLAADTQKLAEAFKLTGDSATIAQTRARDFFAEFRGKGPASAETINSISETLKTLFLNAGDRAAVADKAITSLGSAGKLTAQAFASWPEQVQKQIADAFKIGDIVQFQRILEKIGGLDLSTVAAGVSKLGEVMRIDPTIAQGWDALIGAFGRLLDEVAKGAGFNNVAGALKAMADTIDSFVASGGALELGKQLSGISDSLRGITAAVTSGTASLLPPGIQRDIADAQALYSVLSSVLSVLGAVDKATTPGALSDAASSLAAKVGQATSDMGGNPQFTNPDQGISAPDESAGSFATGGVFTVAGSGGTDSKRLRANVTPGEVVAIIPQANVSETLLASMQGAIDGNSSPADNSTIKVAAPASYKATNASKALADLLGSRTSSGGQNALGLTPDQVTAALAQIAAIKAMAPGSNVPGTSTVSSPAAIAATAATAALAGTAAGIDKSNPVYAASLAAQAAAQPGAGSYVASITHGSGGSGGGGGSSRGGGGGGDLFGPYQGRDLGQDIKSTYNTNKFVDAYNSPTFGGGKAIPNHNSGIGGQGGGGPGIVVPGLPVPASMNRLASSPMFFPGGTPLPQARPDFEAMGGGTEAATSREQFGPFQQYGPFQDYGPFAPSEDQYQSAPSYSDNYDFSQYYPSESFGNDGGFSGSSNMFGDEYSGGDSGYDYYGGAFAKGGSFVVPGSGPTDSVNVRMKMTPGERAIIIPPGSDNYDAGGFAGGGVISTSVVNPTNTDTPEYKAYQAWLETQYPGFSNVQRLSASALPSPPPPAPPRLPLPSIDLGGGPASVSRPKAVTEQPKVFNFFGVTDMNSFQLSRAALNRFARQ